MSQHFADKEFDDSISQKNDTDDDGDGNIDVTDD